MSQFVTEDEKRTKWDGIMKSKGRPQLHKYSPQWTKNFTHKNTSMQDGVAKKSKIGLMMVFARQMFAVERV